jgi:pre-mRNA-splicing factor SYF2
LKLLEKQEAEDKGEDYERKQFWKYSAESAAAWEKKMAKKARMANNGFTGIKKKKAILIIKHE